MRLGPGAQLELAALLGGGRIDPGRCQPLEVGVTSRRIDDMKGLLATREALVEERQQHTVFFLMTVKKRADMLWHTQHGAREPYRLCACTPRVLSRRGMALVWSLTVLVGGVHRGKRNKKVARKRRLRLLTIPPLDLALGASCA
jgi:hypothetical protein